MDVSREVIDGTLAPAAARCSGRDPDPPEQHGRPPMQARSAGREKLWGVIVSGRPSRLLTAGYAEGLRVDTVHHLEHRDRQCCHAQQVCAQPVRG